MTAAAWEIPYPDGSGPRLKVSFDISSVWDEKVEISPAGDPGCWVDFELLPAFIEMLQSAQAIISTREHQEQS